MKLKSNTLKTLNSFVSIVILLCLVLTGCGRTSKNTIALKRENENLRNFNQIISRMTKTGDMLYFLNAGSNRMLYTDLECGVSGYLCGKPECTHVDENCNAFLGTVYSCFPITSYKDKIYWTHLDDEDLSQHLFRMDVNGQNHEEVLILAESDNDDSWPRGNPHLQITNGYAVASGYNNYIQDGEWVTRHQITIYKLDNGERTLIFDDGYSSLNSWLTVQCEGNYIYYSYCADRRLNPDFSEDDSFLKFFRYNLENGKTELLYENHCEDGLFVYEFTVRGDQIWFIPNLEDTDIPLYHLDLTKGTVSMAYVIHEYGDHWLTDSAMVSYYPAEDYQFRISLTDFEGKILLDQVYNRDFLSSLDAFTGFWYCGADEDRIYFRFEGTDSECVYIAVPISGSPLEVIWHERKQN